MLIFIMFTNQILNLKGVFLNITCQECPNFCSFIRMFEHLGRLRHLLGTVGRYKGNKNSNLQEA